MPNLGYISEHYLTRRDTRLMPQSVQATLRERKRGNEVLVRLIQLAVVVFFGLVYFIAPKTTPDGSFNPVPAVLAVYFVLSVIGLFWSLRRDIPDWAPYCSILFDFGLLYALIISFHFQYMQPASFVLKAPTLLYVFIFIAIRALRMEVRFVVAAGVVAAIGWLGVILYVTQIDDGDNMLTRSYVEYLTSNTILIGAEVDKIITIAAVTGVLVLVVNGANNLLITAVSEGSAAQEFSRFFDKSVAAGIRNSAGQLQAGSGDRRTATIINIDIRGFSKLAANAEPSTVMRALSAYQGLVVPIIQQRGGLIDKFMGDGVMATFGIDEPEEYRARQAVEAAEAILVDSRQWHMREPALADLGEFSIGIGIASGTVAFGTVGQNERLEMTVIGSPVNTSAKLEKHNKVLGSGCVVTAETWQLAVKEGYQGSLVATLITMPVDGMSDKQEIAVLSLKDEAVSIPMDRVGDLSSDMTR